MQLYEKYRPLLLGLAYRMLGSISDAEDIVQDVYMDYLLLETDFIKNEKAYLARMITNRCLNFLGSARNRRETYVGNWLPEPSVTYGSATTEDPAVRWDNSETVTYAMLVMLERLSGIERAIFILRETLAFDYSEISSMINKSESNCRKIFSRAKEKLGYVTDNPPFHSEKATSLAQAFIEAAKSGNTLALITMLKEDALMISDGGGKVRAAIFPILGRDRIIALLLGLSRKGTLGVDFLPADVNGQSGLLLLQDGVPKKVITFQWDKSGERIEQIYFIMNPEKLRHVTNAGAVLS
ncbi:RNA polymerase sigma-70 factor [Paenibacillus sp. GSMTC-2017]|uniref:RNA polymerase sigma-70 factor n=1 Tax=Paenibacillus sp. GSMTC-2017 TaxID=2794350 RepID=UPI0018D742B7|nr:RNA polymerase sigma-70 factor [Paenibacillus sp. GSMTC-2017]MBH5320543.1 RNA polymerase sigma-70 factor [Paenibacillus sp. GSMTC-2017]